MGQTTKGYPYPEATDPVSAGASAIQALAQALDGQSNLVTALPATPTPGQVVILVDTLTAAPAYAWMLQWAPAPIAQWLYLGGAPARSEIPAGAQGTASTTYVALATPCQITVPRAGTYEIDFGYQATADGGASQPSQLWGAPKLGAAATADANSAVVGGGTGSHTNTATRKLFRALVAADVVAMQYRVNANTGQFDNRWLALRPVFLT